MSGFYLFILITGNNCKEPRKEKDVVSPTIHENSNGKYLVNGSPPNTAFPFPLFITSKIYLGTEIDR